MMESRIAATALMVCAMLLFPVLLEAAPVKDKIVRIELKIRHIHLSEVGVLSGTGNVALGKNARQSTDQYPGKPCSGAGARAAPRRLSRRDAEPARLNREAELMCRETGQGRADRKLSLGTSQRRDLRREG